MMLEAAYGYLTTKVSECSHTGHSNVRRSYPGASGSIRASIILLPHFPHGGRTIAFVAGVAG